MTIKVVNFEILSRHYKNYQDGITKISDTKKEFIERLDPFKKEMETIINKANNGEKLTEEQEKKFQEFQNQAVEIDEDFKFTMRKMNDELSKAIYSDLSNFINEWTKLNNEVDLVIGSTEVVFLKEEHDVTEQVLEIIKEIVGEDIAVITQGEIIANSLSDYLDRHASLAAMCSQNGETYYFTTETSHDFDKKASAFLHRPIQSKHVVIR